MKEVFGDIWEFNKRGYYVGITTNGNVDSQGRAVMGKGIALDAKKKYHKLPGQLGRKLKASGNFPHIFTDFKIITFPTKKNWWDKSEISFIVYQAQELVKALDNPREYWSVRDDIPEEGTSKWFDWDSSKNAKIPEKIEQIFLVRPGCNNGGLNWEKQVRPVLMPIWDDRVTIVETI